VRVSRSIAGCGADTVHAQAAPKIIATPTRVIVWLIPCIAAPRQ
jgi:hypothetical protein